MQGLQEISKSGSNSILFEAERQAYMNGFHAGEREAETNVMEDDAVSAHAYNTAQDRQQQLLDQERELNLKEEDALHRTAILEAMEHKKLAAWSARERAEAKLLAKAQNLKMKEGENLRHTAEIENRYADALKSNGEHAFKPLQEEMLPSEDMDKVL